MEHRRSIRWAGPSLLIVSVLLALLAAALTFTSSNAAAPEIRRSEGRVETCTADSSGGCTVAHGFGEKPSGILVQPSGAGGDERAVVNPANTTETTYRVTFRVGGQRAAFRTMTYTVHYDFGPSMAPPPTTTAPPPPPTTEPPPPGPSPVKDCTSPSFTTTSSNNIGDGRTFADHDGTGEYFVHNNMWNNHTGGGLGPSGTYSMRVCDYDNWTEDVTQLPTTGDQAGAVRAYPNIHRDYNDVALDQIQKVRFAATDPECAGCIYNVAFDAWLDSGFTHELMIWTRNWNQRPAGNQIATATIDGRSWQVWRSGSGDGGIFTYVAVVPEKFGTINFQAFVNDTRARGWVVETTWQVDYGVETVDLDADAGPGSQRFHFTDFQIFETGEAAAAALSEPRVLTADQVQKKKEFKAKYDSKRYPLKVR